MRGCSSTTSGPSWRRRVRAEPDDTLLSSLVNTEVPEWGRPLTDNELHAEMFADVFVGGSETTTNALAEGSCC